MGYQAAFTREAEEELASLDPGVAQRILLKVAWLAKNFESVVPDPLSGSFKGLFKLRVGSYRVIYSASSSELVITIHGVGHRRDIYK
ncbi:MAG TPA: type II toxin-antitoxin system RelE/ParE family toxin [Dehalococcoidia bacterium]|nr:type II toxin-antitoxin system RelE/ParE family toxin [Dehalococcoidia bacterium]